MTACAAFRDIRINAPTLAMCVLFRGRRQWPQARESADPGGHEACGSVRRYTFEFPWPAATCADPGLHSPLDIL